MPDADTYRLRDLVNAAALLTDALGEAPERVLQSVGAAQADALVIVDDHAADIKLENGVTVHVRGMD